MLYNLDPERQLITTLFSAARIAAQCAVVPPGGLPISNGLGPEMEALSIKWLDYTHPHPGGAELFSVFGLFVLLCMLATLQENCLSELDQTWKGVQ